MSARPWLEVICALALGAGSAMAQSPSPPAPLPPPASAPSPALGSADPFGLEVMMTPRKLVAKSGVAKWDTAFETLVDAIDTIQGYMQKEGLKAIGPALVIYTSPDDAGFHFQAGLPIAEAPRKALRNDLALAESPAGRALKFVHRGSYHDAMDNTYEAITNHLEEKLLEYKDLYIEEYVTDPVSTPEDELIVNIFVPLK